LNRKRAEDVQQRGLVTKSETNNTSSHRRDNWVSGENQAKKVKGGLISKGKHTISFNGGNNWGGSPKPLDSE